LHVPDCPGAAALRERLAPLLAARNDVQVRWQVVTTAEEAGRTGMTGSPTILADGTDLFPAPALTPSLSCRLYPDEDARPRPAPTSAQLRRALAPGRR
jgi:hypothetical protein